ncbi:MAG: hypothetical protein V4739_15340 [Pseudomonadota bacterium]
MHTPLWPSSLRRAGSVVLWTVLWLVLVDLAVNLVLDPRWAGGQRLASVSRYFNFGRSVEGKLVQTLGPKADRPNAVVAAGWIDPAQWQQTLPAASQGGGDLLVAVYGQSFAFNTVKAMAALDGRMTPRLIGGPAAPLSHSYAAYRADAALRRADVVVVGILASSLGKADALSGLSWNFESPAPFTYPKFALQPGAAELTETSPVLGTEQAFRTAFAERGPAWQAFKAQLREHDQGYDAFAFNQAVWDHSALVRLVRRGWVSSRQHYAVTRPAPEGGDQLAVARVLLARVQQLAAARGEPLVVVLFQDRGAEVNLVQALGPTLDALGVRYIATDTFFAATDPAQFIADGHYTEAANAQVAAALLEAVRPARAFAGAVTPPGP